jgi:DNA-directed RNA polymerase subunit RPC12/RpoP
MLSAFPKVSDFGFHVNTVSEQLHENRSEILGQLFFDKVLTCQQRRLRRDLGDRYSRLRRRASFACPKCGGRRFIRKGRRWRLYTSMIGKRKLPIVQIQCRFR